MDTVFKKLADAPDIGKPEKVDAGISYFSSEMFNHQIKNLDKMTEHQIFNLIKSNIDYIATEIINNNSTINTVLTDMRFLRPFSQVVSSIPISYSVRLCANKICYDYFTSDLENNDEVKHILLQTSYTVNRKEIQQLMAVGLDQTTATNLVLCRYSSMNERVNVKRLNFVICSKDPDIMTEQMIVWIYEKLFDSIAVLFNSTMLEYYVPDDVDIYDNGADFMEIFSTISLAILEIVNNMPTVDISRVISGYVQDWEYTNRPHTRISLRSLSADFGRIQAVVDSYNAQGIYVP